MNVMGINASDWFAWVGIDPQFCGRVCLTLAHSLWQVGLLAALATLAGRLVRSDDPERIYAIHVAVLFLGLAGLPLTFAVIDVPALKVATFDVTSAANRPEITTLPRTENPAEVDLPIASKHETLKHVVGIEKDQRPSSATFWLVLLAPWIASCYAAGVMLMALRTAHSIWQSHRLARSAVPITGGSFPRFLNSLARTWSLQIVPTLAQAQGIVVPQVVGILRPMILLPSSALSGLTTEELEMILTHELAHVRRHDMWINLVQRIAEAVLFFNPGLWYLTRRISTYREYCCDEQTCRSANHEPADLRLRYAQALLRVVELSGRSHHARLATLAATGNRPSELRRRVARLFGEPLREPVRMSRGTLLTLIAGVALVLVGPTTWQTAAEPKDNEPANTAAESTNKIEVVAIGTHDEEPQKWWDAEGELLKSVPFTWKKEPGKVTTPDKLWRRVVIRVNATIANSPTYRSWHIVGARGSAGGTIEFTGAFEPGTYLSRYFSLADGSDFFGVRFGLALSEWQTIVKTSGMGAHGSGGKSVVFSEPIITAEGINVVVSHNVIDQAYRVIAVDKEGDTHESVRGGGSSVGQISQSRATFPRLALEELDHFEFQTRPYEWTEIKDLPVEPGKEVAGRDLESHFYVLPVTTELQRVLLKNDDATAYLNVNVKAFLANDGQWIQPANKVFVGIKQSLNGLDAAEKSGMLFVRLDFGTLHYEDGRFENLKQKFSEVASASGFPSSKVVGEFSNEENYTWHRLRTKHRDQVVVEPGVDVRGVKVYAVKTPLSRFLVKNADCYVKVAEALRADATTVFSAYQEVALRHQLAKMDFDNRKLARIDVALVPPRERVEGFVAQQEQGAEFQQDAIDLLHETGFEKVAIFVDSGSNVVKSDYPASQSKDDMAKPSTEEASDKRELLIKVVDENGKPLEGAKVFRNHRFIEAGAAKNEIENETYFTDAKGEAVVKLSRSSVDLRLWASKPGYVPLHAMWAKEFQSDGDQVPESFEFKMKPGTKIGGMVTDEAGKPIQGVQVEVVDASAESFHIITAVPKPPGSRPVRDQYLSEGAAVVTDAEGKWELTNVPADNELVFDKSISYVKPYDTPLCIRFTHPNYETIDGIKYYDTTPNPFLKDLRQMSAKTVMKWVDKNDPARPNAIVLEEGEKYEGANFRGRTFSGQRIMVASDRLLAGANLSETKWTKVSLGGGLKAFNETNFSQAYLNDVEMTGDAAFQEANFKQASLKGANLSGNDSGFQLSTFQGAKVADSYLIGGSASFQGTSFKGAVFQSSILSGNESAFQEANFDNAKLIATSIVCKGGAAFQSAGLNNTEFSNADLSTIHPMALESCEFDAKTPPRYDSKTKFPEGFDPQEQGWKLIKANSR